MSKKEIRNMTMKEIIEKVGIILLQGQITLILKDEYYEKEIVEDKCLNLKGAEAINYILENYDKIDKERAIFLSAWNLKMHIEGAANVKIQDSQEVLSVSKAKENYAFASKLIRDLDIEIPNLSFKKGRTTIKEFWTTNDLFPDKKTQKNKERKKNNLEIVQDLKDTGFLDRIFNISSLDDFQDYLCYYPGNGKYFNIMIQENGDKNYQSIMQDRSDKQSQEEKYQLLIEEYRKEFDDVIEKYCDKFDMEKFLLVSAYRAKVILENDKELIAQDRKELIEIMDYASEHLSNKRMKVYGKVYVPTIQGKANIEYSYKELQDDLSRVLDETFYFSKQDLVGIKKLLLTGQRNLSTINGIQGLVELLNFNTMEKNKLIELDPSNFKALLSVNALNREEIDNIIKNDRLNGYKIDDICLLYLYEEGLIEKSDLVKLYMVNQVDLSKMVDFACIHDGLQAEITTQQLMEYYQQAKQIPEKEKDFDRYRLLFIELKIKGKRPEEQEKIAEQIVEEIYQTDSEYDHDFKNLYQANLLPIQTLIAWNGEDIIYDLIKNSALRPRDTKSLLMSQELDLPKTCHALRVSNLSDEEKLNFIFSSFNGTGNNEEEIQMQNEARMYLLQAIHVSKENVNIQKNVHNLGRRMKAATKSKENRYVTDPVYRWQLFSELDEDCNIDLYLDGTAKVSLPNLNKVIIEKLFKATKEGTKINYGAATYIMSQEEFYHHKEKIEQDGRVNRRALVEMGENQVADRLVHSSKWGRALKQNLEISQENGYDQEKIERIDTLVNRIEKARELLD